MWMWLRAALCSSQFNYEKFDMNCTTLVSKALKSPCMTLTISKLMGNDVFNFVVDFFSFFFLLLGGRGVNCDVYSK